MKYDGRIGIYLDIRDIANANVRELRLEEVGLDPGTVLYEVDNLYARSDKLPWMNL